ncbi:hypothetical protein ACWA5Z_12035 [Testudinibacter sp. P80/BLE/0925]|uniref:hypothetical protein n=1 Tax=Testudinibacter sp. TW-1 TaxID=3417757 RepID=UPI003D362374
MMNFLFKKLTVGEKTVAKGAGIPLKKQKPEQNDYSNKKRINFESCSTATYKKFQ